MSLFGKIFGDLNDQEIKKLEPIVAEINSFEKNFADLSDEELKGKTDEYKDRLSKGTKLKEILPEAFATVREASKRTLNMRHFDVQLMGGLVLHQGRVAELKTGEGKTLMATLAVYLNALSGKGVHVVTVNEYLAKRDAEWMEPIYTALGITVGYIYHGQEFTEKKEAYNKDVTYGTNNEFGFDYLRDNMASEMDKMVQRPLKFAIVDEVDSILIDEARTPLIISSPAAKATDQYYQFAKLVPKLKENEDFNVDEKLKAVTLTDDGISKMEKMLGIDSLYEADKLSVIHHLEQALRAYTLFKRDKEYVVKDEEVIIVDEFTGRLMPGRRFSEGLHQALEAKEGVEIQKESLTLATITFQNYFRLYKKLSGMTGTAKTEEEEFQKIYGMIVVVVPTNKEMIRNDKPDRVYKNETGKFEAIIREAKERNSKGQPVLIGTVSIEKNEDLSSALTKAGVPHKMLNAKNHEQEANIIADAGKIGAVTLATNMAGRGVDVKLGGSEATEEDRKKVLEFGGLFVLGTERHESRRIDNQLRGRSGRQGDPGESQFFVSMDDELLRIFGSDRMKGMMEALRVPDDQPIENRLISRQIEAAQKKVEGNNFDIRKHIVEYDDVMNKHREVIYKRRFQILQAWQKDKEDLKEGKVPNNFKSALKPLVLEMIDEEIDRVVSFHTTGHDENKWNLEEIYETMNTITPLDSKLHLDIKDLRDRAGDATEDVKARNAITQHIFKLIHNKYEEREQEVGIPNMRLIERSVLLRTVDNLWIEHLDAMERLREGVRLRGYGNRDPLVEYKKEGFQMFQNLLAMVQGNVAYSVFKIKLASEQEKTPMEKEDLQMAGAAKTAGGQKNKPIEKKEKVGRNDPCPCGSGKKYKKCHG
ncbi:MAG: preprotein translocase subunit SecA [bacterium]